MKQPRRSSPPHLSPTDDSPPTKGYDHLLPSPRPPRTDLFPKTRCYLTGKYTPLSAGGQDPAPLPPHEYETLNEWDGPTYTTIDVIKTKKDNSSLTYVHLTSSSSRTLGVISGGQDPAPLPLHEYETLDVAKTKTNDSYNSLCEGYISFMPPPRPSRTDVSPKSQGDQTGKYAVFTGQDPASLSPHEYESLDEMEGPMYSSSFPHGYQWIKSDDLSQCHNAPAPPTNLEQMYSVVQKKPHKPRILHSPYSIPFTFQPDLMKTGHTIQESPSPYSEVSRHVMGIKWHVMCSLLPPVSLLFSLLSSIDKDFQQPPQEL